MPWQEMSIVDRRREFAMLASLPGSNMAELCRRFGISRPTGYKWLRRSGEGESFEDRSRRPRSSPGRTAAATETAVLALRASHRHGRLALGRHPFRARRENAEGRPRPRQGLQPEIDIWTTLPELCKGLVRALAIWTTLPLREGLKIRQDFQGRGAPLSANGSPSVFPLTPPRNSLRKFRPSHRGRVALKQAHCSSPCLRASVPPCDPPSLLLCASA